MKSNIYYSVYHSLYDNIDSRDNVLSDIRKKYFETGSEIKNKITKEIDSVTYRYSYHIKYGQPLKWKKMYGNRLLEKSQLNNDGSYSIVTYDEYRRVIKVQYYSWEHEWIKSEYLAADNIKKTPSVILMPDDEYDKIKICYKECDCESRIIEMVRCNLPFGKVELYSENFGVEYLICDTYKGMFFYCEADVKEKIVNFNSKAANEIKDVESENEVLNVTEKPDCNCKEKYFYIGSTKNSLRDGRGRTAKSDGKTIYEGTYKGGERNGFGVLYYTNDELCYAGEWKNNKRDGIGVSFNTDQRTVHVGAWKAGKLDGIGTKFDKFGNIVFSGTLDDGKINGVGVRYNLESKSYIIEQWDNGVFKNKVTQFSPEGKLLYYGEVNHLKRHGYGVQYNDNGGIIYEGYWENDHYNGTGTILHKDHRYTGSFKDSKPYGKGIIYKNDGTEIHGIFLNSKTNDCDTIKFEDNIDYYFIPSV